MNTQHKNKHNFSISPVKASTAPGLGAVLNIVYNCNCGDSRLKTIIYPTTIHSINRALIC